MVAAWQSVDVDAYDHEELKPINGWAVLLAELDRRRPAWQLEAACRHAAVEQFFPARGDQAEHAKALCATCPVAVACDAYRDELGPAVVGIWGGRSVAAARRRAA